MKEKITIGRKDYANFPELEIENIPVKVDTGAYTSSIHCHKIEQIKIDNEEWIQFFLLDPDHPEYNQKPYRFKNYREKKIKSSNGESENRYIISTKIILFDKTFDIELSLSERGEMKFPVLLGRKLLNKKFIVDTSLKNLSYKAMNIE